MTSSESPATPERQRIEAAQHRLREGAGDAIVLFPSHNLQYTTDFDESPGERHLFLVIPHDANPVFFAPELYETQLREETAIDEIRTWADGDDPVAGIHEILADLGIRDGHLLVDDEMWALFTQDLRVAAPDATFGLASEVLADLRMRKDDAELDALGRAADLADAVVEDLRELGRDAIGMTEAALAEYVEERLAAHGGDGVSFATIVGSGPNGAKPHYHHGDKEIDSGEPVVLDFGTRVDEYPSDQTRTLVFGGDPDATVRQVHELVRTAQNAAVGAVEPGVTAAEVDRAAREVIEDAGYGEEFVHRTGHGVGLDVHEAPFIVEGNDRELEPGMVFSVEPGVYLPGEFGVRIEDIVVVTADGCERLNTTARGWETSGTR